MATIFRREWDYLMNQFGDKALGLFYVDTKDQIKDVYGEIVGGKTYLIKASTMRGILITDPLTLKQFADWVQIDQPVVFKVSSTDLLNSGVLDANFNYEYADDPDTPVIEGILNHKYIRWKGEFYDVVGVQKALVYKGETSALYFVTQKNLSWETLAGKSTLVVQDDTPTPPTPVKYTVTVDDVVKGQYTPGTLVTLTTPTKEGYVFKGWSSSEVTVTNGSFTMPDGNVTVTSMWEQEVTPDPTFNVTIDGVLLGAYVAGALVNINAGTKEGYTFAGWTAPSSVTLADPSAAATTFTMPSEEVVLTTNWTEVPVTTYNVYLSGTLYGQYAAGALVTVTAPEFEDVYQERGFNHWETVPDLPIDTTSRSISFTMPSQDVYLTPVYAEEEIDYWVVTVLGVNGDTSTQGVPMTVTKGQAVSLSAGTKSGYNFSGWTIEGSGVGVFGDASSADTTFTPSTDVTVKANWTVIVPEDYFVITYVGIAGLTTQTVKAGTKVSLNAGSKEGYTFNGWTADPSVTFSSQSVYSSFTMPSNDVTITANWTIQTFTLTVMFAGSAVFTQTYDYNTTVDVSDIDVTLPTGLLKDGFYNTAAFSGEEVTEVVMTGDATLYLKAQVPYTFVADDVTVSSGYVTYNTAPPAPTAPTKEGYEFNGWTLDGSPINTIPAITTPTTFVADWIEASADEFSLNCGDEVTGTMVAANVTEDWTQTVKLTSAGKSSYNQHVLSTRNYNNAVYGDYGFGTYNTNLIADGLQRVFKAWWGETTVGYTTPPATINARNDKCPTGTALQFARHDVMQDFTQNSDFMTSETRDDTVTHILYVEAYRNLGSSFAALSWTKDTNVSTAWNKAIACVKYNGNTPRQFTTIMRPSDVSRVNPSTAFSAEHYRRSLTLLKINGVEYRVQWIECIKDSDDNHSIYRVELSTVDYQTGVS